MPIDPSVLQRRHWQDGRIRIGIKTSNSKGATYPKKLSTFRFTSPSRAMIEGAAELYGGEVKPWTSPDGPEFEVITNAKRVRVVLPPNPYTQNMELWDGPSCVRRCDGLRTMLPKVGTCLCGPDTEPRERPCKPHTRLAIHLHAVPSLGTWRLDSKGWNAAEELPTAAEFLAMAGRYVDGILYLVTRKRMYKGKPVEYVVPRLTVEGTSIAEHLALEGDERPAITGRSTVAITAGDKAQTPDYLAQARGARSPEQVKAIWRAARDAGHLTDELRAELNAIGAAKAASQRDDEPDFDSLPPPPPPAAQPPVSDPEGDRLRQQIMAAWTGTITDLHAAFNEATGTTMKNATPDQLNAFIDKTIQPSPPPPAPPAPAAGPDEDDIVDADVVEDDPASEPTVPPATEKQLRDLAPWFSEAGVTINTGKGSTKANDDARFAWIAQHIGVEVESTKQLSTAQAADALKLLTVQAAARRDDLRFRIVTVWADMGGTNDTLTDAFETAMKVKIGEASNTNFAAFLQKLSNSEVTPDGAK